MKPKECLDCGASIEKRSTRCRKCAYRWRAGGHVTDWGTCPVCGVSKGRSKYCSRACYEADRYHISGPGHPSWLGEAVSYWGARKRTTRGIPAQPCEVCGVDNADRHHVDRNIHNNDPSNIRFLCRSHHAKLHRTEDPPGGFCVKT